MPPSVAHRASVSQAIESEFSTSYFDSLGSRLTLRYPRGFTVYVARPTRSILLPISDLRPRALSSPPSAVFIFLKTMLNMSLVIPQWQPKTPPAWLSNLMDRIGSPKYKNTNFSEFWKETDDQEAARVARNEKPMEA
jgi:hypothetical protein